MTGHIIEPERHGIWIAVTFIIALLAFVVAIIGFNRTNDLLYITQTEVLLLNKKIENVSPAASAPAEPAQQERK